MTDDSLDAGAQIKYGYYSELAHQAYRNGAHDFRPLLWRTSTGEDVRITCVGPTRDPAACGYLWPDAECVGEVVSYIGPLPGDGNKRPIIFSTPMVQAILDGRKTQTRRIVKPQPMLCDTVVYYNELPGEWRWMSERIDEGGALRCPYGGVGGVLWVRESFHTSPHFGCLYRADYDDDARPAKVVASGGWKPSIYMPRSLSCIDLEITGIRVERLQEISEADAQAEGARCVDAVTGREVLFPIGSRIGSYRVHYRAIWESIHGAGSWESNPFVWVIEFRSLADGR